MNELSIISRIDCELDMAVELQLSRIPCHRFILTAMNERITPVVRVMGQPVDWMYENMDL